jgi:hypothetical protein
MRRVFKKIITRLADENGASLVEAAMGMPIMNFIIFGYIVLAYGTILLMSSINNAGTAMVNFLAFHEKSWVSVNSGAELVITPNDAERLLIGTLVERGTFYDFRNPSMVGFANTLGGLVAKNASENYMRNPSSPVSRLTVGLSIERYGSDLNKQMKATVSRESPLLGREVKSVIYVPNLD